MGRRKIEIQPITRKNGLFKKAYELGVLCSVDVAVIIFEERPGHHAKLYQYCSTDVNAMVQRHLRFDGERDTKGPADFSNHNNKQADNAEDDDDDADDDDASQKRREGNKPGKVKVEGNSSSIVPIRPGPPQRRIRQPRRESLPHTASLGTLLNRCSQLDFRSNMRVSPTASSSSLPISSDRHTSSINSSARGVPISNTAKRPRLDIDQSHAIQSAPAHLGPGSAGFPYRLDIDLPSYPSSGSIVPALSQLHSQHPSLTALYSGSASMANLMSGPAAGLLPQPFDLSRGAGLRTVAFPQSGNSGQFSPQGQHPPPGLFSRGQSSNPGGNSNGNGGSHGHGHGHGHGGSHSHASASNLFADLLGAGAGEHGNGMGVVGSQQFPTFDWPVHAAPSGQASHQGGQGQHENATHNSPTSDSNWFDFLSAPAPPAITPLLPAPT
ncbi:hypothetical protein BN946_scf184783.g11 [Trametes cinnabarina]|uniref:MADS-box domain-containing protein n=1 Tax=Pycnoporus cinnabarinus TaxID=5643 RepID=A0A060S6L4_PYCCI|nr:hypothetical protein BN946_scf184783.g11 [Trametes cinnabarina]